MKTDNCLLVANRPIGYTSNKISTYYISKESNKMVIVLIYKLWHNTCLIIDYLTSTYLLYHFYISKISLTLLIFLLLNTF